MSAWSPGPAGIVFNDRNQYDSEALKADGFEYYGVGRR